MLPLARWENMSSEEQSGSQRGLHNALLLEQYRDGLSNADSAEGPYKPMSF